jgi:hypothetical protein
LCIKVIFLMFIVPKKHIPAASINWGDIYLFLIDHDGSKLPTTNIQNNLLKKIYFLIYLLQGKYVQAEYHLIEKILLLKLQHIFRHFNYLLNKTEQLTTSNLKPHFLVLAIFFFVYHYYESSKWFYFTLV